MKNPTKKNEIVDKIMKDLKKSNLPLLAIDAEIAHVKKKLSEWEIARDNAHTPEKRASYIESVAVCRANLETINQEKKEIIDATMGLIRLAVRSVIEILISRYTNYLNYEWKDDYIVLTTKRQPFHVESIEKFGSGITFSIPIKDGSLRDFMISKIVSMVRRERSRKSPNFVRVYFQKMDKSFGDATITQTGFKESEPQQKSA